MESYRKLSFNYHQILSLPVSLCFVAPEVLAVYPYGHTADWWSLGILMYAMLVGKVSWK